jgi:hypothetical protein
MIIATFASLIIGGLMVMKQRETEQLYAPKGYLASLQSKPRSVYNYNW